MKLHTFIGLAGLALLLLAGCEKEGVTTRPKLIFKSASTTHVLYNHPIAFTLEFRYKAGDFNDSIRVIKVSSSYCPDPSFVDSATWTMPDLSGRKNVQGELEILMTNLVALPCDGQDTVETAIFKFLIKDLAGNVSDTAFSPPITIEKN